MAPKKAAAPAAPAALPVIEDEVQWPEGVGPVPDPSFRCATAHLVSHTFFVALPPAEDGSLPPLEEYNPCEQLMATLKDVGDDPFARPTVPVSRDVLESIAEGGSLAQAFVKKVEAERLARHRRKVNDARNSHIAKQAAEGADGEAAPVAAEESSDDKLDLVLALVGYPANAEELEELKVACGFEATDAWVSIYLAGHTVEEIEGNEEEGTQTRRIKKACIAPDIINLLYDAIHVADLGSGLANSTMRTSPNTHLFPSHGENQAARVNDIVMQVAQDVASLRHRFDTWISAQPRKPLTKSGVAPPTVGARVYERLADAVDPSRHDVAFLLHCMCEQVAMDLQGDVRDRMEDRVEVQNDDPELDALFNFLDEAHDKVLLVEPGKDSKSDVAIASLFGGKTGGDGGGEREEEEPDDGSMVLAELDQAACRHYGYRLPGNVSSLEEVHRLLARLEAPGVRRSGFPSGPRPLKSAMTAARNKLYGYMPDLPIVEIERLFLVHEFEKLINEAQPEREWVFKDRVFHERIPANVLIQTLQQAVQAECFVETRYLERHDCLLVALHHRSPAGCLLWHSWVAPSGGSSSSTAPAVSDSKQPADDQEQMCPVPSFNDWRQLVAEAEMDVAEEPKRAQDRPPELGPITFLDVDGRDIGYCKVLEKLHIPSDGSVIRRTSFQRGLSQSFLRPSGGPDPSQEETQEGGASDDDMMETGATSRQASARGETSSSTLATAEAAAYSPTPRNNLQVVRVMKDGLTFGVVTDEAWSPYASRLRKEREEREKLEAEAAAAAEAERLEAEAARVAQGLPEPEVDAEQAGDATLKLPEEETEKEEGKPGEGVTSRLLEALEFGVMSVMFPDGARCSARMHHERRWYEDGSLHYDSIDGQPGVLVTYSPRSGMLVQVFSNGHVRQTWPQQLVATALSAGLSSSAAQRVGASLFPAPPPVPTWAGELGGPEDVELARVMTPFGILIRELLSGRREMYSPDGSRAMRNPTREEMEEQRVRLEKTGMLKRPGLREALERLARKVSDLDIDKGGTNRASRIRFPTITQKTKGLAGHWRVTRPDGRMFGRVSVPVEPVIEAKFEEEGGDPEDAEAARVAAEHADDDAEEDLSLAALLEKALNAVLVDNGTMLEYEIDMPASVTPMIDPHTGHMVHTSGDGLVSYKDLHGSTQTMILPDGTHMIRSDQPEGSEVLIEKERAVRTTCMINDKSKSTRTVFMTIDCDDGTQLRVTPQTLNFNGDLQPADPTSGDPDTFSTNAAVVVMRPDGAVFSSKGAGEVDLMSNFDSGGGNLGSTLDRGRIYTGFLDHNKITLNDRDGNKFEVMGCQQVEFKLAVSMGDNFSSPRLKVPGKPYRHPDAGFLPVPERAPEPRLLAIYGEGDAEELLLTRDAHEALRLARTDEENTIVMEERMSPPMQSCKCHTIMKSTSSESTTLPRRPLHLPPVIAAFAGPEAGLAAQAARDFTQFRQLMEHPYVPDEKRAAFIRQRAAYEEVEEKHRLLHLGYGSGFGTAGGGGA